MLQETPLSEWYVQRIQSHWDIYRDGVRTTGRIDKASACFLESATSRDHFPVSIKAANMIPDASLFMTVDMVWQEPDKGYNSQAITKASISLIPRWGQRATFICNHIFTGCQVPSAGQADNDSLIVGKVGKKELMVNFMQTDFPYVNKLTAFSISHAPGYRLYKI